MVRSLRGSLVLSLAVAVLAAPSALRAQVVVNEIHYHPSNAAVAAGEDAERLQFVELHNRGAAAADISGWSFSDGLTYTFPAGTTLVAGTYLVLAKDPAFLALRGPVVPAGVPVLKWTSGDLNNGGETLTLVDATAAVRDTVTYGDAGLWPAAADGAGPSLELTNPAYDKRFPLAWRASAGSDGTPGRQNSRFTAAPIVLLDAPARNSVVGTLAQVAVTFSGPVTGVAAGSLAVDGSAATAVTGSGAGPYVFTGFAAPKANPFVATLAAGAISGGGVAFGGDSWSYFRSVPRVVINEIHYNPQSSTDDEEFIELYNADPGPVDVGGWKVSEFASPGCAIPAGTVMQPGTYLVCAKDPAALKAATGFQATLGWGANDSLSNGGEPISLLNASGAVVDRVEYDDDPPWPAGPGSPDGNGPSLELTNPGLDNAMGQFWRASAAANGTPGARNSAFGEAPVVASEAPARGAVIVTLPTVTVTFSKPVTGVTAGDLEVDGVPATGVTGSGAGPYVFTTGGATGDAVTVVLNAGGITDDGGRPFAGDAWLYFVGLPRLVLNEVHYHPAATAVGAGEDPERLQFLEIYNDDAEPVDLAGFAVTDGVGLIFPAGTVIEGFGFAVVARDPGFLKSKVAIPAGVPVLAWTGGDLGNGGETIRLSDPYGREIDVVKYDDKGDWTDAPDGGGPSLELIHPALANDHAGSWKASTPVNGTPGKTNSVYVASPAPVIWGATHFPPIPKGGQSVTITVFAIDEGGAAPAVTLMYRQDRDPPIAYSSTPMFDDGLHGDGAAGDGRFGAVVPGLADGQQLDFFVAASDGGATAVAPPGHAVNDSHGNPSQTYLCKFSNEVLPNDLPVYHILVTRVNKRFQEAATTEIARKTPYDSTFIDDKGNIFYNVEERYRGQSSIYKFPSSYSIDFPSNRRLDSVLGWKVETLQLNSMRPAAQAIGFDLFNRAGVPAPKTAFARLRYTGINYDTCCNGQNGYYGAHVVVERYDNDFLDSQGGDVANRGLSSEGQLYRGRNDADFRWLGEHPDWYRVDANEKGGYQKYNHETDDFWGDLIPLIDALSNTSAERYVEHVKAHVDVDLFARYFAVNMLLGNREGGLYRDTGDDYFVWLRPVGDPASPPHPDYGTAQMPAERTSNAAVLMPWDTDAILWDANETIWRTNVAAMRTFLRHNAFAPIFVKAIEDFAAAQFSPATMNAVIDAMPAQVFGTKDGSDVWPETKQQYKNWIANRVAYCLNETVDDLTLTGVPASPYTGSDPLLRLSGRLQQAGTHAITVNGAPATFSAHAATWSYDLTLKAGWNPILVVAWDRDGKEKDRVESPVMWNPTGTSQIHLEMRTPRRMLNDRTLTIEARILDPINRIAWQNWETYGKVSVVRLPDRTPVPVTMTKFNDHVAVPNGSLRFVNGWGSVSFALDQGAAFAGGDVEVSVEWNHLRAAKTVTVLAGPTVRSVSGVLSGANLTWGPDEVIRVTGNCTVPAGQTLRIHPGTLVQVNTTGTLENGTLITVQGNLAAVGARDNPIFFFSERGASAMTLTQSGSASNGNAWRGIQFYGTGSSTMRYVFLTGAGNGNVVSHPRPPILGMFSTHSIHVDYSVFADNCGMAFSGQGTGKYTIRRNLVSRVGIGGEFFGNGHALDIRDTWWTNVGHAPEANGLDGDLLHVDGPNSKQTIRGCIIADGGDDGIDHNGSNFAVQHSIIHGILDKSVSMTGGHLTATNVLMFNSGTGIRGTASTDHVTIATAGPIAANDEVFRTIVWPGSVATCSGDVSYSYVGNASDLGCGDGNASINPQYTSTAAKDYNPKPGSPALTAGPDGERIGWLGFPYGATCKTGADCNDENACTADTCVDKLCVFTPILGCVPCETDVDCDDGEPCTSDVCAYDGSCSHPLAPTGTSCDDGKACTSPDTCTSGVCGGPEACPPNQHCDDKGACAGGGGEPVTVTFQQGVNGYSGTHDTFLREYRPDTAYGQGTSLWWDLEDPKPYQDVGLLRFAGVFGPEPGRIPGGALVTSAVLTVNVEFVEQGGPGAAGAVSEAWVGWDEATATWGNFGGEPGVQPDEYGPMVAAAPTKLGAASIDVTAQIQAWAFNPAGNNGWIFLAKSASWIGITTSEGTIVANRPKLTVTYEPPGGGCISDAFCDDGRFCNGKETCNVPAKKCVAGVPPTCDDANACTADACDAAANACANVPDHAACDDGDACTDDVCVVGAGGGCANPAKTPACDDGVACTTDGCDPIEGCTFTDSCGAGFECDLATGTCRKGATVATFQQGVGGYDGTLDTYVHAGAPA
ncbi:MAG: lamin tail domain-containing protein, partial [Deltaproteobacteria bacterium]|nr:lamin tail domain-containing protein [Deltaproteobacteria bacterium]